MDIMWLYVQRYLHDEEKGVILTQASNFLLAVCVAWGGVGNWWGWVLGEFAARTCSIVPRNLDVLLSQITLRVGSSGVVL